MIYDYFKNSFMQGLTEKFSQSKKNELDCLAII